MSDAGVVAPPCACSGLKYWTEPSVVPGAPSASAARRAIPKSVMSARPSRASSTLLGFTSRWTIPRMCATASAREMSSPSRALSAIDRAPVRRSLAARSSPSISSMTRNGPAGSEPVSRHGTMFP